METSILTTIKKACNVAPENPSFDLDIVMYVNTVFVTLSDLGVGPPGGFMIEDDSTTWDDYIPNDKRVNAVKTYISLVCRMYFDPPSQSWTLTAMEKQIEELAWRINVRQEATDYFHEVPDTDVSLPVLDRPDPSPNADPVDSNLDLVAYFDSKLN